MQPSTPKILIVDDDLLSCKVGEAICSRLGYTPRSVENGECALKLLRENDFDLILLDWCMPLMGGAETIAAIRNGDGGRRHTQIPIIVTTADAFTTTRAQCLESGASAYMLKPLDLDDVSAILRMWLS